MIGYSQRAVKALAFLFRRYNDIDIYVEDMSNRNMYEVLFQRMLEGKAKVSRVFQLGGRNAVIEACRNDQLDTGRNRLYVVDGDSDLWTGVAAPNLKHLYRLRVYTSENLVFSETAMVELSLECLTNSSREEIRIGLRLSEFSDDVSIKLLPLFVVYAAVWILGARENRHVHISTTGYSAMQLCDDRETGLYLSDAKITQRIDVIKGELVNTYRFSDEAIVAAIAEMETKPPRDPREGWRLISGKTYLLPLLFHYLRRQAHFSGTLEQLKVRLARHCELDVDEGLMPAVLEASQA